MLMQDLPLPSVYRFTNRRGTNFGHISLSLFCLPQVIVGLRSGAILPILKGRDVIAARLQPAHRSPVIWENEQRR